MATSKKKSSGTRGGSNKRELLTPRKGDSRYATRRGDGTFKEMDDVGRSQQADKRSKAKKTVRPGYGDQGDTKQKRKVASKK